MLASFHKPDARKQQVEDAGQKENQSAWALAGLFLPQPQTLQLRTPYRHHVKVHRVSCVDVATPLLNRGPRVR